MFVRWRLAVLAGFVLVVALASASPASAEVRYFSGGKKIPSSGVQGGDVFINSANPYVVPGQYVASTSAWVMLRPAAFSLKYMQVGWAKPGWADKEYSFPRPRYMLQFNASGIQGMEVTYYGDLVNTGAQRYTISADQYNYYLMVNNWAWAVLPKVDIEWTPQRVDMAEEIVEWATNFGGGYSVKNRFAYAQYLRPNLTWYPLYPEPIVVTNSPGATDLLYNNNSVRTFHVYDQRIPSNAY